MPIIVIQGSDIIKDSRTTINDNFAFLNTQITNKIVELSATGDVDSVNTDFVFTENPTYIIRDGSILKQINKNGTVNWLWDPDTLTASLAIAPSYDIFGLAVN